MANNIKAGDRVITKEFKSTGRNGYAKWEDIPDPWYLFTPFMDILVGKRATVISTDKSQVKNPFGFEAGHEPVDMGTVIRFDNGDEIKWDPNALEIIE